MVNLLFLNTCVWGRVVANGYIYMHEKCFITIDQSDQPLGKLHNIAMYVREVNKYNYEGYVSY